MITERTLKKWRKASLTEVYVHQDGSKSRILEVSEVLWGELHQRIIRMTQELLDQHLLRRP